MRTFGFGFEFGPRIFALAAGVSLAAIMQAELNNGDGININWLADHVEIVDSVGDTSYSGPILDHPDFTFTGTKKKVVGPNGLLRWTAHNLFTHSEDFSDADWTKTGTTVTTGFADPDGGTAAARIVGSSSSRICFQTIAYSADTPMKMGAFVKSYDGTDQKFKLFGANTIASSDLTATDEWQFFDFEVSRNNTGTYQFGFSDSNAGDDYDILVAFPRLFYTPADETYVPTTDAPDYGLPTEYDILTLDGSTDETSIAASGEVTLDLDGSVDYRSTTTAWADSTSYSIGDMVLGVNGETFTCTVAHTSDDDQPSGEGDSQWKRDDLFVRVSATDDVDGAYMLGRVKSQSGTSLTLEVLKSVGSGSYDDWHVIAVKCVKDEPVATNQIEYSQDFANAAWTKNAATITSNAIEGPDGLISADKLVPNSSSSAHYVLQATTNAGGTQTRYVIAKAGELDWLFIFARSAVEGVAYFNLSTGTIGTVSGTASPTAVMVPLPNDYYLCALTAAPASNGGIGIGATNADNTLSFVGDSSSGIYIWHGQFTYDAVHSSVIPTAGSAVERAADVYSIAASDLPMSDVLWSQIDALMSYADTNQASEVWFWVLQQDASNYHRAYLSTSGPRTGCPFYNMENGGSNVGANGDNADYSPGIDVLIRYVTSADENVVRMAVDVGKYDEDDTGLALPSLSTETLYIGCDNSSGKQVGGLRKTIFGMSDALTEAQLRARAA